jgi:chromosome segregation ATPase
MSFGIDALFEERLEVFPAEPSSALHATAGHAEAVIKSLIKQRDDWEAQAKEYATEKEDLQRRLYAKLADQSDLPTNIVRRLHRLENDCQRLRVENTKLHENLKAAESETTGLRDKIVDQTQKVKGANKKTKNAKEVAGKVEEKAQDAMSDKKRHLESERKMRKEKNDALAALQEQSKLAEDLRAELSIERSGKPHLRETEGTDSNFTTVVIPMEFFIRRAHYPMLLEILESNRINYVDRAKEWYERWAFVNKEEVVKVVGANYVDDESMDKLYGGMIEGGLMMTGAEHDSWRSMKGLEAICRNAHARHNG